MGKIYSLTFSAIFPIHIVARTARIVMSIAYIHGPPDDNEHHNAPVLSVLHGLNKDLIASFQDNATINPNAAVIKIAILSMISFLVLFVSPLKSWYHLIVIIILFISIFCKYF